MAEAHDRIEAALRDLAHRVDTPAPSATLADRVLARLSAEPVPGTPSRLAPARRLAGVAALLAVALLGLLLATPVGATVADWFDFHGVVVDRGDDEPEPTGTPTVPPVDERLSLAEAARLVDFTVRVPGDLGEPDRVAVGRDHTLVSTSWGAGEATIRLDQFDGRLTPVFRKSAADAQPVAVGSTDALWFPTAHELAVLGPAGERVSVAPRLAAQTLIWEDDGVTFRLEGRFARDSAVTLAESLR